MEDNKRNILFIVNPFAGYHSKDRVPALIERFIPDHQFDLSLIHI